jgi:membrane-anchored glycerophosphoryl diester phosphodiesterase (GDPDase)
MIQLGSIFNASFGEARGVVVLQAIAELLLSAMLLPQIRMELRTTTLLCG